MAGRRDWLLRRPHADASVGDGSTQGPHACASAASACTHCPHPHANAGDPSASAVRGIANARHYSASAPHRRANAAHRHTRRPHRNASARDPCASPTKPARECPPSAFRLAARTHQPVGPALRSRPLARESLGIGVPVRRTRAPVRGTCMPVPRVCTRVLGPGAPIHRVPSKLAQADACAIPTVRPGSPPQFLSFGCENSHPRGSRARLFPGPWFAPG
jgi:hypothetical protein